MIRWAVKLIDKLPDRGNLLRIVTYHRVDHLDARTDLDPSLISATPGQFQSQVDWLARDFDIVALDDVLAAVTDADALPKRALLLTFDDAYQDFASHAWPILRQRAIPATMFVPTAFPDDHGRSFWWDRLYCAIVCSEHADRIETPLGPYLLADKAARLRCFRELKRRLKSLPEHQLQTAVTSLCEQCHAPTPAPAVMDWNQLIQLSRQNISLVPHTHTHPLLDRITLEAVRSEVQRSRAELQQRIGSVLPVFAYPSGHFNEQVAEVVRDEGFKLAFSTVRGVNDLRTSDPMLMRRANVGRLTPDPLLHLQLTSLSRFANRSLPKRFAKPLAEDAMPACQPDAFGPVTTTATRAGGAGDTLC